MILREGEHPFGLAQAHADMGEEELYLHIVHDHKRKVKRSNGLSRAQKKHIRIHEEN